MQREIIKVNGAQVAYYLWTPPTTPVGAVQLAHGMAEHLTRYDELARFLNQQGYIVFGADHRGHGHTPTPVKRGYFGDGTTWEHIVSDLKAVQEYTQQSYPALPYFLIGHSMGSMLTRSFLVNYAHTVQGAAIIGTGLWPGLHGELGLQLAKLFSYRRATSLGRLLSALSFAGFNRNFAEKTEFAWLSRDSTQVAKYQADPLCGFLPTNAFFRELFRGLKQISTQDFGKINADIPLFIASGSLDPVGGAKVVAQVAAKYRECGVSRVIEYSYVDARHEIFNELNRKEVFNDLGNWLQDCLS